ncbi:MAG TPA: ABC transporter permease [Thermoanaerobaculia bacterium]|nr:ABC transporter permease [Thermoanaerobaculia bacterium]
MTTRGTATHAVYTASASQRLADWHDMARDLVGAGPLAWRLFLRDFSAKYRQSLLGYLWALVPPVVTVGLFAYLSSQRIVNIPETSLPYPAYALLGMTIWGLFSIGLTAITSSLGQGANLVRKMSFPREALVCAAFGQGALDTLLRAVPTVIVFVWLGVRIHPAALLLPVVLVPLVLLTVGIGFVLSIVNVVIRDVANALRLVLQFGLFLTPVLYPPPETWPFALITILNPVSSFVVAAQDIVARGTLSMPGLYAAWTGFAILLFLAGWRFFRLAQPIIAERI